MKVAVLGDLHFISPSDPKKEFLQRGHFAEAWPSFKKITDKIRKESPDLVICLGDLVDWYSEENRDFAIELLEEMNTPWAATPGNHDFSVYEWNREGNALIHLEYGEAYETTNQGWKAKGIDFNDRIIEANGTNLILMNSAYSDVLPGTREWLRSATENVASSILFTHVPPDTPEVREFIHERDPKRKLQKYVQSRAPWIFDDCIHSRISDVFSGHLHLSGSLRVRDTSIHIRSLSISAFGKKYPDMGQIAFMEIDQGIRSFTNFLIE